MNEKRAAWSWGMAPLSLGGQYPIAAAKSERTGGRSLPSSACLLLTLLALPAGGCSAKADKQTYDPVALGMMSSDTPFYDDGETVIYQVKRAISLPARMPSQEELNTLAKTPSPPYARAPWINKDDVKVQVTWTLSNLDPQAHDVEVLLDPWSEFARYVPGVNVGEESTVPDLSGIDLLTRVDGLARKSGIFTYDDMDEVATDLATVQQILVDIPAPTTPAMTDMTDYGANVNGMINHTFEIHNRSNDDDKLVKAYIPKTVAGLIGFDLGLRLHDKGTMAIEIQVEMVDVHGNRLNEGAPLKIDGTMWMTPAADVTAPMGSVR